MQTLCNEAILQKIREKVCFECQTEDHALQIKITEYSPFIATAIHHGTQFRGALEAICALPPKQRYYEEAPVTAEFVSSFPMTLVGLDSRYEYDLNRAPSECIYDKARGVNVWNETIPDSERAQSLRKHFTYYSILKTLAEMAEATWGFCVVYDIQAYNYHRFERDTPVFNIGTQFINKQKWRNEATNLKRLLEDVSLPNTAVSAAIDDVTHGGGYQAEFCRNDLKNTLCLPLSIKKIYMDEDNGEQFPLVIEQLKEALKHAVVEHVAGLIKRKSRRQRINAKKLLGSKISPELRRVDQELYHLAKNLNTLSFINPVNLKPEKKRFMKRPHDYVPQFRYRQLNIDPYRFKERLYSIAVHTIQDASIEQLYRRVIEQLAMRVDLLTNIGTQDFLYNSLRYYGQPMDEDLHNASFILHARVHDKDKGTLINTDQAVQMFVERSEQYGIHCKIQTSDKLVAGAVVDGLNLKISSAKCFYPRELEALIEHELGIHLVTSANAAEQPLNIFKIGLPGNTHTQEGLAIMSEHLTGNLSVSRLKTLALRVICVHQMLHGASFNELYFELITKYAVSQDAAFSLATRVFRSGGFTKDYLYLSGLKNALRLSQKSSLTPLLVGKTAFEFLPLLEELITREIIKAPKFIPNAFTKSVNREPIVDYLISSIH